jgi:hypothetical protein
VRFGTVAVVVVGWIAAVVVVIVVGVVLRVHRTMCMTLGRHRRAEAIVVVAVGARTVVVAQAGGYVDDHPAFVARPVPIEGDGVEVFEGGEAVKLVAQLVVGHDGEGVTSADAVGRDVDGNPLDAAGIYFHPFVGIVVTGIGIEVDVYAAFVGIVANVFNVVVDGDGVGVIDHHGLRH